MVQRCEHSIPTHLFFNLKQAQQPYRKFVFPIIWALQFIHHDSVVLKLDGVSGMFMRLFYRKWSTWKTAKSKRNQTNAELKCSRLTTVDDIFTGCQMRVCCTRCELTTTVNSGFTNYIKCINVICMIDFDNHSWDSFVLASYLWLRCWSLWNWLLLKLKL